MFRFLFSVLLFCCLLGAVEIRKRENFYEIYDGDKVIGFEFYTDELVPEVRGYGGPIRIKVRVNLNGEITDVELISHSETPEYVVGFENWVKQFIGKKINDKFVLNKDVIGITGATITSSAVTQYISVGLKKLSPFVAKKETFIQKLLNSIKKEIFSLSVIFLAIVCYFVSKRYIRYLFLVLIVIYFGIIKNFSINVADILQVFKPPLPNFFDTFLWYVLLMGSLVCALIFGACYCGWLCPFGFLSEVVNKLLPQRLKVYVPDKLHHMLRFLKYLVLVLVVFSPLLLKMVSVNKTFFHGFNLSFEYIFAVCIFVISIVIIRFWCRYICPMHAVLGLFGRLCVFRKRVNNDICTICQKCIKSCPMGAITLRSGLIKILNEQCIQCNTCKSVCPKRCIF